MVKFFRKFFGKIKKKLSFYEILVYSVLFILTAGYVVYLKTASTKETIYVRASIQRPDWWQSDTHIPRELLSSIKVGEADDSEKLKVVEFKHFISEQKDWENYTTDRSIGRIQFQIEATKQPGKYLYKDQELFIGNPLIVILGNTRLELLITDIEKQMIKDDYTKKRITVKVYSKFIEEVNHIKEGMELKDNDGFVYAKVLSVNLDHSLINTVDQWGKPHLEKDALKYDVYIVIETLAQEKDSRLIGYDDRTIGIGKAFIFNSPQLDNIGGWIVEIN